MISYGKCFFVHRGGSLARMWMKLGQSEAREVLEVVILVVLEWFFRRSFRDETWYQEHVRLRPIHGLNICAWLLTYAWFSSTVPAFP